MILRTAFGVPYNHTEYAECSGAFCSLYDRAGNADWSTTMILVKVVGYTGVALASPLAWIGACLLLIPVYYRMERNRRRMGENAKKV